MAFVRPKLAKILLTITAFLVIVSCDQSVRIVSHQSPIMVREGTNVTLQCEANGSMNIHWKVNSTTLSGSITISAIEARGIFPGPTQSKNGNTISFLQTLASIENNRTVFTCLAYQNVLSQNIYKSYPVTLIVFGRLTPPLRLSSSPETAATLQLKWEPPFSLQGEKISYLLRARNLRSNMTIEKVAIGTWTTFKSPQEDHACDRYEFTVCSNNEVGLSDPCTAVNTSTPYGPQSVKWVNVSTTMLDCVTVTLSFNVSGCPDYPMTSYSITLSIPDHPLLTVGPFLPSGNNPETVTITGADGLLEDRMYTAIVEARNQFGRSFSKERAFSTPTTHVSLPPPGANTDSESNVTVTTGTMKPELSSSITYTIIGALVGVVVVLLVVLLVLSMWICQLKYSLNGEKGRSTNEIRQGLEHRHLHK